MKKSLLLLLIAGSLGALAQEIEGERSVVAPEGDEVNKEEFIYETFGSTRVMYNHSTEMISAKSMDFIVSHKFGDILTRNGAGNIVANTDEFMGIDNLADVRLGFEFGILDRLDIGVGRSKGIGVARQVVDGYAKFRIFQQKKQGMPISLVFVSSLAMPYSKKSTDSTSVTSYPKFIHRFIFTNQLLISKKFGERFSVQLNVGYNHRNFVDSQDHNGLFFAGAAGRLRVTKHLGVIVEYNHSFPTRTTQGYYNPLTFGVEIITGGHSFVMGYTNARGMNENLFIPMTQSNWLDGQFRLGFSFSRRFKL